jgi:flagellar hook-length control protein FliK
VHVPDTDVMPQLVQAMRTQFRDGIGEAKLRLRPEHLGEVTIALRVEHQSVSATINADLAAVRDWIETKESALRQGLAEHGLHLEELVVREDEQRPRDEPRRDGRPDAQARRVRRSASQPQFEVMV